MFILSARMLLFYSLMLYRELRTQERYISAEACAGVKFNYLQMHNNFIGYNYFHCCYVCYEIYKQLWKGKRVHLVRKSSHIQD